MKNLLAIFTSLLLFISSPVLSQPEPSTLIQPLMDCLKEAIAIEKAKPNPQLQGVKDACVNEMQMLALLSPNTRKALTAEIEAGISQHLVE